MHWALPFLAVAGCVALAPAVSASASKADALAPVVVKLSAVGGSHQTGRIIMRQLGPQIVLSGTFANEPPNVMESARLHKGPCGSHAPVLRELRDVTNGTLGTILLPALTVAQLHAMHASISVSRSDAPSSAIVSCGNL